jgi:N-formylglutamate amidohydrolase
MPNWLEESFKLYNQDFEKKLEKLSGSFGYRIIADPA